MKRSSHRWWAHLLVVGLLLSLVACSSDNGNDDDDDDTSQTTTATETTETTDTSTTASGDATAGKTQYDSLCASCHGADGSGGTGPSLRGCATCGSHDSLMSKISSSMPTSDPNTCIDTCASDTAAYIFSEFNGG